MSWCPAFLLFSWLPHHCEGNELKSSLHLQCDIKSVCVDVIMALCFYTPYLIPVTVPYIVSRDPKVEVAPYPDGPQHLKNEAEDERWFYRHIVDVDAYLKSSMFFSYRANWNLTAASACQCFGSLSALAWFYLKVSAKLMSRIAYETEKIDTLLIRSEERMYQNRQEYKSKSFKRRRIQILSCNRQVPTWSFNFIEGIDIFSN